MTYFPLLRRDYILWRLAAIGEVQRADIMRSFEISQAQASGDINALLAEQPTAAAYDKSAKRYVGHKHQPPARLAKLAEALGWD